jgi:hypothetical protein
MTWMIRQDYLDLLGMNYPYDRAGLPTAGLPGTDKAGLSGSARAWDY